MVGKKKASRNAHHFKPSGGWTATSQFYSKEEESYATVVHIN